MRVSNIKLLPNPPLSLSGGGRGLNQSFLSRVFIMTKESALKSVIEPPKRMRRLALPVGRMEVLRRFVIELLIKRTGKRVRRKNYPLLVTLPGEGIFRDALLGMSMQRMLSSVRGPRFWMLFAREALIKSRIVMPAKAGIQDFQGVLDSPREFVPSFSWTRLLDFSFFRYCFKGVHQRRTAHRLRRIFFIKI